jgi:hypothetical protein
MDFGDSRLAHIDGNAGGERGYCGDRGDHPSQAGTWLVRIDFLFAETIRIPVRREGVDSR